MVTYSQRVERTENILENESELIIEEMMRDAEAAQEPGTLHMRDVLHRSDEELPATMIAGVLRSAGYVFIYDNRTGERSLTNNNMLPAQLRKTRKDGSLLFSMKRPKDTNGNYITPQQGIYKCELHPDSHNRSEYDTMGFAVCPKQNLGSMQQVRRHMAKRHKDENAYIQEIKQESEKKIDRELQRQILAQLSDNTVQIEETGAIEAEPVTVPAVQVKGAGECPKCGKTKKNLALHIRASHGE